MLRQHALPLLWIVLNISLNVYVKFLFSRADVPLPLLLLMCQQFGSCMSLIGWYCVHEGAIPWRGLDAFRGAARLAVVFGLTVALNNVSLVTISLTLNQCIKATCPVVVLLVSMVLEGKRYPPRMWATGTAISAGVVMAAWNNPSYQLAAVLMASASTVLAATYQSLSGFLMSRDNANKLSPGLLLLYQSGIMAALICPAFLALELPTARQVVAQRGLFSAVVPGMACGTGLALAYNLLGLQLTSRNDSLFLPVLGNLKSGLIIVLDVFLFDERLSRLNVCGVALTVLAFAAHAAVKRAHEENDDDDDDNDKKKLSAKVASSSTPLMLHRHREDGAPPPARPTTKRLHILLAVVAYGAVLRASYFVGVDFHPAGAGTGGGRLNKHYPGGPVAMPLAPPLCGTSDQGRPRLMIVVKASTKPMYLARAHLLMTRWGTRGCGNKLTFLFDDFNVSESRHFARQYPGCRARTVANTTHEGDYHGAYSSTINATTKRKRLSAAHAAQGNKVWALFQEYKAMTTARAAGSDSDSAAVAMSWLCYVDDDTFVHVGALQVELQRAALKPRKGGHWIASAVPFGKDLNYSQGAWCMDRVAVKTAHDAISAYFRRYRAWTNTDDVGFAAYMRGNASPALTVENSNYWLSEGACPLEIPGNTETFRKPTIRGDAANQAEYKECLQRWREDGGKARLTRQLGRTSVLQGEGYIRAGIRRVGVKR